MVDGATHPRLEGNEVPGGMPVGEIIEELTRHLGLPQHLVYQLRSKALGRALLNTESLNSAGIPNNDTLRLSSDRPAGGGGGVKFSTSNAGLLLDSVEKVDPKSLLSNEPALAMAMHTFNHALQAQDELRQRLDEATGELGSLRTQMKDRNTSVVLVFLAQLQIGFGINLVTGGIVGGWVVLMAGIALNVGALYFAMSKGRAKPDGQSAA